MQSNAVAVQVLLTNLHWMSWNLFLAFIPLVLSVWLFRIRKGSSWVWWLLFLVFFAFLPNAPYLLTDIIHMIKDIRTIQSVWIITLTIIPLYFLVILTGFEAYVISLINWGYYLQRIGKSTWILWIELITHALCAVGIYWGRFLRFNSWDFITQPDAILTKGIEELMGKQPSVILFITFVILTVFYWIMKWVTLGAIYQLKNGIKINQRGTHST